MNSCVHKELGPLHKKSLSGFQKREREKDLYRETNKCESRGLDPLGSRSCKCDNDEKRRNFVREKIVGIV